MKKTIGNLTVITKSSVPQGAVWFINDKNFKWIKMKHSTNKPTKEKWEKKFEKKFAKKVGKMGWWLTTSDADAIRYFIKYELQQQKKEILEKLQYLPEPEVDFLKIGYRVRNLERLQAWATGYSEAIDQVKSILEKV